MTTRRATLWTLLVLLALGLGLAVAGAAYLHAAGKHIEVTVGEP